MQYISISDNVFCNFILIFHKSLNLTFHMNQMLTKKRAKYLINTVKPVLSRHSKIDKIKVFKTCGSLVQVESIAAFCDTFVLH